MCCLVEVHLPLESWSMSGEGNFGRNMFFTAFTSPGYMQLEAIVLASFTACQDHRSYEAKTLLLLQLLLLLLLLAPGSWLLAPSPAPGQLLSAAPGPANQACVLTTAQQRLLGNKFLWNLQPVPP